MKNKKKYKGKIVSMIIAASLICTGSLAGMTEDAWATPASGTAADNQVNVRETAVDGEINATLDMGQEVTILEEAEASDGNIWYRVSCTKNETEASGWVRADMINTEEGGEAPAEEAEPAEGEETPEEIPEEEHVAPSSVTFTVGELTYSVMNDIPGDLEIPEILTPSVVAYAGQELNAYQFGDSDVFLFYMKNVGNDQDRKFFVYDTERDAVFPFNNVGNVVILNKPVEEKVSAFYLEVCCDFPNGSLPAYQASQATEYSNGVISTDDFYYVYGCNLSGEKGWYCYDAPNGTLQRCTTNMQYVKPEPEEPAPVETTADSDNGMSKYLTYGASAAAILFLILFLVMAANYRKLKKQDEVDLGDLDEGESWLDKMDEVNLEHAVQQEKDAYREMAAETETQEPQEAQKAEPVVETVAEIEELEPEKAQVVTPEPEKENPVEKAPVEEEPEFFDEEAADDEVEWLEKEVDFLK